MYSNADSLLNKKQQLEFLLNCITVKPQIIALTEVNYKNKDVKYDVHELCIHGYVMYHNIQNNSERGVAIHVSSDLDSIFVESAFQEPEFVFIEIEVKKVNTLP